MKKSVIIFIMAVVLFIGLTHSASTIEAASSVNAITIIIPKEYDFIITLVLIAFGVVVIFWIYFFIKCIYLLIWLSHHR